MDRAVIASGGGYPPMRVVNVSQAAARRRSVQAFTDSRWIERRRPTSYDDAQQCYEIW
jgi:hypothetical protein